MIGAVPNCTKDEAKKAWRTRIGEVHPDKHPNEKERYTKMTQEVNAAWDRLRAANGW